MEFSTISLNAGKTGLNRLSAMDSIDLKSTATPKKRPPAARLGAPLSGAVILLGTEQRDSANIAKAQLRQYGAATVHRRRSVDEVAAALTLGGIDLLQLDLSLDGGGELSRDVRFGKVGANPFLPIILTTWRVDAAAINTALEAGADDLVAHPMSAATISKRASRLAATRKPFVAGNNYIGPERPIMSPELEDAPRFEAPNTLRALASGDAVELANNMAAIEAARHKLFGFRIGAAAEVVGKGASALLAKVADAEIVLDEGVSALMALTEVLPEGSLLEASSRLAALGKIAAKGGADAERAAKLTVEISDAINLILGAGKGDQLVLPPDIMERIDSRFPQLAASERLLF